MYQRCELDQLGTPSKLTTIVSELGLTIRGVVPIHEPTARISERLDFLHLPHSARILCVRRLPLALARDGRRNATLGAKMSACGPVVGRFVRDEEVGSSNLPTPTNFSIFSVIRTVNKP